MFHCDAHFHLSGLLDAGGLPRFTAPDGLPWRGIVSCHELRDLELCMQLASQLPAHGLHRLYASAGIHPEFLHLTPVEWVAALAKNRQLIAVGECGFDYFAGRDPVAMEAQEQAFRHMLDIALEFGLPLVIHNRRAADALFRHIVVLKKLRSVIFHSCSLPYNEILSLLDRGVEAWFSFGTPALWAGPKLRRSIEAVPVDRLLTETDAPCQPVRGRDWTALDDLVAVEASLASIKGCTVQTLLDAVNQSWQACGFGDFDGSI